MHIKNLIITAFVTLAFGACNSQNADVKNMSAGPLEASNKPVTTETGASSDQGMSFDDYLNRIKQPGKLLLLVDFNAVWCSPCKMIKPYVEKEAAKNKNKLDLWSIDIDKNPEIAKSMNIKGIPLLILYKQGKEVWRNLGLLDEKDIASQIAKFSK